MQTTIMRRLLSLAGDVFHHRQDMVCELNNGLIVAITVGNGSGMAARRKDNICRAVLNLSEYAKRQCGLDLLIGIGAEIPQVSRYHIPMSRRAWRLISAAVQQRLAVCSGMRICFWNALQ